MTRAQPGAGRTAARLAALGFEPVLRPLLEIRRLAAVEPDLSDIAALAFTSVNGVDAFTALTSRREHPVFTVGDATAEAALAAGFARVRSAAGALPDLARLLADAGLDGPVLAPGARQPAGDLPALLAGTVEVRPLPVYESVALAASAPEVFDAVLVHSPRGGEALADLGGFDGRERVAVAISEAAAAPLRALGFADLRLAARPTEASMLEALGKPVPHV